MAYMRAKVLMMEVGMAMAAISVGRQFAQEQQDDQGARIAPTIRCSWTFLTDRP